MSNIEIRIDCECIACDEKVDMKEITYTCESCIEEQYNEGLKEAIEEVYNKDYLYKDKDDYVGFESDKETEIFMKGIKRGMHNALFWICDYYGQVEFFEKLNVKK